MATKKFQRRIEDFVCEHCGAMVVGNGYTNHCPKCLWSKHVDVNPGDRAATCLGLMEPIGVEGASPHYRIVEKCTRCSVEKRYSTDPSDNVEAIITLARSASARRS